MRPYDKLQKFFLSSATDFDSELIMIIKYTPVSAAHIEQRAEANIEEKPTSRLIRTKDEALSVLLALASIHYTTSKRYEYSNCVKSVL